jgi:phosphatidylserine decarboxylase
MVITGLYYALGLTVAGTLLGGLVHWGVAVPFYFLALFCLWFFRDPDRRIPPGTDTAVSPADGKVVRVRRKPDSSEIDIFLNVFDVHVNRAPIAGKLVDIDYRPGKFLVASKDAASLQNEQNKLTIDNEQHSLVAFSQIAGLIARRIICYKKPGEFVTKGERVGLIQFGSRVDVFFGPEWEPMVQEGQRVSAGSSVIARRKDSAQRTA